MQIVVYHYQVIQKQKQLILMIKMQLKDIEKLIEKNLKIHLVIIN